MIRTVTVKEARINRLKAEMEAISVYTFRMMKCYIYSISPQNLCI